MNLNPAATHDRIYLPLASGNLVCLNVFDGSLLWKAEIGGEISASPTADEQAVYLASAIVGEAKQASSGASSSALRALGAKTGVTLWLRTLPSQLQGGIASDRQTIYAGARDGRIFAISKATGENLWVRQFPASFNSYPLVAQTRLYIGAEDGIFLALDQKTGRTVWCYQTRGSIRGVPLLSNGMVFVGSMDGYVHALDATDGRLRWRMRTGAGVQSIAGTEYGLLASSLDNFVYMLSFARGNRIWKRQLAGRVAAPALATSDGALLIPLAGDAAVVLDLRNGKQLNSIQIGIDSATAAAPVITVNRLLIPTRHGLLAFSSSTSMPDVTTRIHE